MRITRDIRFRRISPTRGRARIATKHSYRQFIYTGSMAAETTTVRVRRADSERLQALAKARQTAVVDVVHAAIGALKRQEFSRGLTGDYQRLRSESDMSQAFAA